MSSEFISFAYLDRLITVIFLIQSQNKNDLELWSLGSDTKKLRHIWGNKFTAHNRATASHILLVMHNSVPIISSGFTNYTPTSLVSYSALILSLVLGLLAFLFIAVRGVYVLIKVKGNIRKEPIALMFLILPSLMMSISLLLATPFMELGHFSFAINMTAFASFLACFYVYLRFTHIYLKSVF